MAGAVIDSMSNNTISTNSTIADGGGIDNAGDIDQFLSNIVAANTAATIISGADIEDTVIPGIINASYNLIGSSGGNSFVNGVNNNFIGGTTTQTLLSPGLSALKYNGGLRWTMALLPTSVAVNAGANPLGLEFDERGPNYLRTRGGQTDIGAYELQVCAPGCDDDNDGVCCDVIIALKSIIPIKKIAMVMVSVMHAISAPSSRAHASLSARAHRVKIVPMIVARPIAATMIVVTVVARRKGK